MAPMESAQFVSGSSSPLQAPLPVTMRDLLQDSLACAGAGGSGYYSREEGKISLWLAALCLECLSPAKHYQKQLSHLRGCLGLENMRKGP